MSGLPQVAVSAQAHALEHSLEVHVPFLQAVLEHFTLVPLAVGHASTQEVAEVLERLWGGPETLIVVSSDLSHYLSYGDAQAVDRATAQAILGLATDISHEQACGATPVMGLTLVARRRGLKPELIDLRNSGDTAGDKNRVVGYGAFAFLRGSPGCPLIPSTTVFLPGPARSSWARAKRQHYPADAGRVLLPLARAAIATQLGLSRQASDEPAVAAASRAPASSPSRGTPSCAAASARCARTARWPRT